MFNNEYDILEIRLSELYDHVDRFVIVESDHSFTNIPKPYNFENNASRYERFFDKIHYVKCKLPCYAEPWDNEKWTRDQKAEGWYDLTPEDIVLDTDGDEIPRPEFVQFIKSNAATHKCYGMVMPFFYFKLNYLNTYQPYHYVAWGKAFKGYDKYKTGSMLKYEGFGNDYQFIHHSGWHFSCIGDHEFNIQKLKNNCHTELPIDKLVEELDIEKCIAEGNDHLGRNNYNWKPIKIDNFFPKTILDNQEKYKQHILETDDSHKSGFDYYPFNICQVV